MKREQQALNTPDMLCWEITTVLFGSLFCYKVNGAPKLHSPK